MSSFINKVWERIIIRLAILSGTLICLILIINWTVPFYWGNGVFGEKLEFYLEHKESINTLFIGSSTFEKGIKPKLLNELNSDVSSFNLSAPGIQFAELRFLLNNMIKEDLISKGTTIYIEPLGDILFKNRNSSRAKYYYSFENYAYYLKKEDNENGMDICQKMKRTQLFLDNLFSAGMLFDKLNFLFLENKSDSRAVIDLGYRTKAYKGIQKNDDGDVENRKSNLAKNYKTYSKNIEFVKEEIEFYNLLQKRLNDKGIELKFVLMPRLKEIDYNCFVPIFEGSEVDKINLADPDKYGKLWAENLSVDYRHLNNKGASLLTKELSKLINQNSK